MAYTINRFNGVPFITVEDGTLDSTTDLKLVGKNYTGYGEAQNENFLHLLESFSGEVAPTKAITGMIWYDTVTEKIRVYDGVAFKATGGAEVSATSPTGLAEGDLWWDTTTNQLKALNVDNEWILIGPQRAGSGNTEMKSIELVDNTATRQAVIATYVADKIVALQSRVEFIPNNTQDVEDWVFADFPVVKAGFNVAGVNSNGISVTDSTSQINQYWGTASAAYALTDGTTRYSPSDFLLESSLPNPFPVVNFGDSGFYLGDDGDLYFSVKSGNQPDIQLASGTLSISDSGATKIYNITTTSISPQTTEAVSLGTTTKKWSNVYATTFTGTATQSNLLREQQSGLYRAGDRTANADTVAVRDSDGDLIARLFEGTATKARYADLAEKYTTCCELEPGTAVAVSADEDHEVGLASASSICIGVVSTDPAIMMNSEAEGQYIALKGRVPVRVKGPVKKGQPVYAMSEGVCTTIATTALVGVALETNMSEEEKKVECVLKT